MTILTSSPLNDHLDVFSPEWPSWHLCPWMTILASSQIQLAKNTKLVQCSGSGKFWTGSGSWTRFSKFWIRLRLLPLSYYWKSSERNIAILHFYPKKILSQNISVWFSDDFGRRFAPDPVISESGWPKSPRFSGSATLVEVLRILKFVLQQL